MDADTRSEIFPDDDEPACNPSGNAALADGLGGQPGRRHVLIGGLAAAVTGFFGSAIIGLRPAAAGKSALLGFPAVPVSESDSVVVPPGYRTQTILPWGEPITGGHPAFAPGNSGADQGMQVGQHHDGLHFFPIEGRSPHEGSSDDGLLVMNHEYVEPRLMHADIAGTAAAANAVPVVDGRRNADQVLKEVNAHGVAIVRIRKDAGGSWSTVRDPRNRRITGQTPMEIRGPVRASALVRTKFSPDGTMTRGTLNNCAHGVTPWNTYLTCEENWAGYFRNGDRRDEKPDLPREHARYGVSTRRSRYGWELAADGADAFVRFDASTKGTSASDDYRNEPNTFGWVVEIDPFQPDSTPNKRTALGRFAHEGVVFGPASEGRPIVCYSGDDARFEYIYKFVSAEPYAAATAGGHLLDNGTLYVARFGADGAGEWLPLVHGRNNLTPENGFADQAEVLVNTRLAADLAGATKLDRPEWGAVDPKTGMVYFALTNNTRRSQAQVDGVNPRAINHFGQIVRWTEAGNDHAATTFRWEIFLLAGDKMQSRDLAGNALTDDNIFSSPDGLWFDPDGRLWIQTDVSEGVLNKGNHKPFGNNQMLAADPGTGEIRRFLTGPVGQEITGVVTTPDRRTMFVNVQHPGASTSAEDFAAGKLASHWPDGGTAYPRSATVVISRTDGGLIGG